MGVWGGTAESAARTAQMITLTGEANPESVLGESAAEAQSPRGAAASRICAIPRFQLLPRNLIPTEKYCLVEIGALDLKSDSAWRNQIVGRASGRKRTTDEVSDKLLAARSVDTP